MFKPEKKILKCLFFFHLFVHRESKNVKMVTWQECLSSFQNLVLFNLVLASWITKQRSLKKIVAGNETPKAELVAAGSIKFKN